jgi:hypothetical protein
VKTQNKVAIGSVLVPVYATDNTNGTTKYAGRAVFGSIPSDTWYTDVVQVIHVKVPDNTPMDHVSTT